MSRKLFALVTGAVLVGAWAGAGPVLADGPVVVEACGTEGCCRHARCPHDGVCVPTTEKKTIEKRVYTDTCEQFCLPKCPLFGFFGGHGCGGCGHDCQGGGCTISLCQPVVLGDMQAGPWGIAIDGSNVYWTNYGGGQVKQCAKSGCSLMPTTLASGLSSPYGIAIDSTNVYWNFATCRCRRPGSCPDPVIKRSQTAHAKCAFKKKALGPRVVPLVGRFVRSWACTF